MKFLLYAGLILLLVPLHTTVLPYVSLWGIKPDVGLVTSAVIGLMAGEVDGLIMGLAIGWVLNMYSAGDLWLSLVTKGGAGLSAGLLGRHVAQVTPMVLSVGVLALSLAGGLVAVFTMKSGTVSDAWWMVQSIVLPQSCFDAVAGAGLFWLVNQRMVIDRLRALDRF
ncbi:MAG: hypothetical protein GDA67_01400 [Nitrospira sp. CR1.3]|nr:hypothetical protein [Nitrospira sp. CR1.3]